MKSATRRGEHRLGIRSRGQQRVTASWMWSWTGSLTLGVAATRAQAAGVLSDRAQFTATKTHTTGHKATAASDSEQERRTTVTPSLFLPSSPPPAVCTQALPSLQPLFRHWRTPCLANAMRAALGVTGVARSDVCPSSQL